MLFDISKASGIALFFSVYYEVRPQVLLASRNGHPWSEMSRKSHVPMKMTIEKNNFETADLFWQCFHFAQNLKKI